MFDRIAGRYDLVNRVMTFGLDQTWRRRIVRQLGVSDDDTVLDVASGTGDFAEIARKSGGSVLALDFSREMLRVQGARSGAAEHLVHADATKMPVRDGAISVIVCGFALRNFVSIEPVLREMARVLRPGGRIGLLEVTAPKNRAVRAGHSLYFNRIVPRVGGLLSDRDAYRYLPASVAYLPEPRELGAMLRAAGFMGVRREVLSLGAAQAIYGVKAG
jgi:demethylmenaquinone methyltransferase/2-methoxy-6-polyprenyl-1,4-benzoquinol methylase